MYELIYFALLALASIISGFLGSLVGLGGGTFLVPIYTLYLGVPIIYATGASLISTIATSSGAASAYVKDRITNVKLGMGLEVATSGGAIVGSLIAAWVYAHHLASIIYIVFGIVLLIQIYFQLERSKFEIPKPAKPDRTTKFFKLYGEYYDQALKQDVKYYGVRWWLGEIIMFFAGLISGLLGIGSGALKVLGMDWAMNLPMKVSTTTSNFMIGVTAATGSSIYWMYGYIQPVLAGVTALGVLLGSFIGTKVLPGMKNKTIRYIFTAILLFLGVEMILRGLGIMR